MLTPRANGLLRYGIDISSHDSSGRKFDFGITICDRGREEYRPFPGAP